MYRSDLAFSGSSALIGSCLVASRATKALSREGLRQGQVESPLWMVGVGSQCGLDRSHVCILQRMGQIKSPTLMPVLRQKSHLPGQDPASQHVRQHMQIIRKGLTLSDDMSGLCTAKLVLSVYQLTSARATPAS